MTRKRSLTEIKKHLNKMQASDEVMEYILKQISMRDERIEAQSRALETLNREALSVEKRKLEISIVDSTSSKLTINPCDGRVSLKISKDASEVVIEEMKRLADIAIRDELPPVTMRGKIKFDNDHEKYYCDLRSESKRFNRYYELNVGRVDK